MCIEIVLLCGW